MFVQGGGAYITASATVTFTDCNIYENTAGYVSAPQKLYIAPKDKLQVVQLFLLWGGRVEVFASTEAKHRSPAATSTRTQPAR